LEANLTPGSNRPSSRVYSDPATEWSRILQEAFGSNALAHHEWRIDTVTTVSVLLVVIKLGTVKGLPATFRIACGFVILGWCAVQLLLFLFHAQEKDNEEMASSIKIAKDLNWKLEEVSIWTNLCYFIPHLPLLAYPVFQLFYGQFLLPSFIGRVVLFA
jgi:hypothetical protein